MASLPPGPLESAEGCHPSPWPEKGNRLGEFVPFHVWVNRGPERVRDLPDLSQ
jgi:hypothetical protein